MKRETLLRKWAELAPVECGEIDGGFVRFPRQQQGRWLMHEWTLCSTLLSVLIEAIRARGWDYSIDGRSARCKQPTMNHYAVITIKEGTQEVGEAPEPSDALLLAYVQALRNNE